MIRCPVRRDDESGFALMFVLFVSTVVMIATASMLSIVSGNVRPARASQDGYAALAAAQSGVQDYLAQLDAHCRSVSIESCRWLRDNRTYSGQVGEQTYTVRALNADNYLAANNGALRVTSAGTANGASKTLTADVSGTPNLLRFTYFSNYETVGTKFLRSYFGPRTITLSDAGVAKSVGLTTGSVVHWNGTAAAPPNGYTDSVCDSLYYHDASNPVSGQGRAELAANRTTLAPSTDFSESGYTKPAVAGVVLPTATPTVVTRDAPCEVRFSGGMTFTGPVYSRDALYITNGSAGASTGPAFNVPAAEPLPPASTGWTTASIPAVRDAAAPYRTDAALGGTPTTTKSGAPAVSSAMYRVTLPPAASPRADCTYFGPTRIVLSGGTATISSPLTPAGTTGSCYVSTANGTGVTKAVVPIATTTITVANATGSSTATPSFPDLTLGAGADITRYSPTLGDAYVEGSLSTGKLSLVAGNDIVVTGDVTTTNATGNNSAGERAWRGGAAIDLVANNNVRVYHPVKCVTGIATDGYCPNDITGLYSDKDGSDTTSTIVADKDGSLKTTHPSKQYENLLGTKPTRIDAAVMALSGSFLTDNFNRGAALGTLTVNGGVYMNHRGSLGQLWEILSTATGARPSSGYRLALNYTDYTKAGLPFVPVLDDGSSGAAPWKILNLSTGGTP